MSKKIIIYQEWGGLGDNLAHTPIPRLCYEHGYKCYLSEHNAFKNIEIYNLLYKNLEYIEGTTNEINTSWIDNYVKGSTREWNHVRHIQLGYGFKDAPYMYPMLNYVPKLITELTDKTLIDISGDHYYKHYPNNFTETNVINAVNFYKTQYNLQNVLQIVKPNYHSILLPDTVQINISSLTHYCDALYSCKNFITIDAGPSNLACTIKNQFKTNLQIYVVGLQRNMPPVNYDSYHYLNATYIDIQSNNQIHAVDL